MYSDKKLQHVAFRSAGVSFTLTYCRAMFCRTAANCNMPKAHRMKKPALALLRFAWPVTIFMAVAAATGVSLPPPLNAVSHWALVFTEFLLTPIVFIPLFIGIWLFICTTFARQSGWAAAATDYAVKETGDDVSDVKLKSISGTVGGTTFSGMYRAGACEEGVVLAAQLLFRPGHPTMLLPWSVVSLTEDNAPDQPNLFSRWFNTEYTTLRVTTHPEFELHIRRSDLERTGIGVFAPRLQDI